MDEPTGDPNQGNGSPKSHRGNFHENWELEPDCLVNEFLGGVSQSQLLRPGKPSFGRTGSSEGSFPIPEI